MTIQKLTNWERLESVIKWANMSTNYFARHIGLLRGENLYQIKRGNNGISRNLADMIVKSFPEINLLWLLTGEGQMFAEPEIAGDGIPFYNVDVESNIRDVENLDPMSIMAMPMHVDGDLAMMYSGRAMGDIIPSNTIVLLKKILPETIIPGGEYVILTKNVVTLRIVCFDNNVAEDVAYGDVLKLVSADSVKYNDIFVNRTDVEMVYKVSAKIMIN
ncbi:MAG: hypothetical protein SNG10_02575 [Rikenellaceae bacterium]